MRSDDVGRPLASARCRLLLSGGRGCLLRRRAWRLVAVTATEVDVGDAHPASFIRAGTRVPLPRCLRSVRPGNITRVDVRVDIGLRIRRRHADPTPKRSTHRSKHASSELLPLDKKMPHFLLVASTTIKSKSAWTRIFSVIPGKSSSTPPHSFPARNPAADDFGVPAFVRGGANGVPQ